MLWFIWIVSMRWAWITRSWSILFLPYFSFFGEYNVTSGENSLEELLSVDDSLFLHFFLFFEGSFEIRFEEDSCLFLAEELLFPLLGPSGLISRGFFSHSLKLGFHYELTWVRIFFWTMSYFFVYTSLIKYSWFPLKTKLV